MKSLLYIPGSDGSSGASLMTVQAKRSVGATTIQTDTTSGVPSYFFGAMGTPHTFTDPVTSEEITVVSEASVVEFAGRIDAGKIEIVEISPGYLDRGSEVGDIVVVKPTTAWADNLANVLGEAHEENGKVKLAGINGGTTPGVLTTDASGSVGLLNVTTDDNGWKVYNFGSFKQYKKRVYSAVGTLGTGASKYISFGTLPVGVTYSTELLFDISIMSKTVGSANAGSMAMTTPAKAYVSDSDASVSAVITNAYNSSTNVGDLFFFMTLTV